MVIHLLKIKKKDDIIDFMEPLGKEGALLLFFIVSIIVVFKILINPNQKILNTFTHRKRGLMGLLKPNPVEKKKKKTTTFDNFAKTMGWIYSNGILSGQFETIYFNINMLQTVWKIIIIKPQPDLMIPEVKIVDKKHSAPNSGSWHKMDITGDRDFDQVVGIYSKDPLFIRSLLTSTIRGKVISLFKTMEEMYINDTGSQLHIEFQRRAGDMSEEYQVMVVQQVLEVLKDLSSPQHDIATRLENSINNDPDDEVQKENFKHLVTNFLDKNSFSHKKDKYLNHKNTKIRLLSKLIFNTYSMYKPEPGEEIVCYDFFDIIHHIPGYFRNCTTQIMRIISRTANETLQCRGIKILQALGDTSCGTFILGIFQKADKNSQLHCTAAWALGSCGDKKALTDLQECRNNTTSEELRTICTESIRHIVDRTDPQSYGGMLSISEVDEKKGNLSVDNE